jgi:hypothetical protein
MLKPMRMTYELEDVPGGTRVTESIAPGGGGFGQRLLLRMAGRVVAGERARANESLRSAIAAAQTDP